MAINKGDRIGDYRVIDFAGSGGMGAVYKIEHLITRRIEAMKLLPVGIGSETEEVRRFEREIQVQARLHHPNIAALYNAVSDGRWIALIMEYVEGESLRRLLERGKLPLQTALDYAGQVLDALDYAHGLGVVHRDVSPSNIIITSDGAAKLTDFGLARATTDLNLTATGMAVGSPWYMSPEQVRAVGELDPRTDIYAMGAVLREMLTGRKLFDAEGSFAVMRAQMEAVPPPPSAHNPAVSAALDEVVARALAKDPAARFQSAGEFRLALEAAAGRARPSAASHSGSDSKAKSRRAVRTRRAAIALILTSAAVIAGVWMVPWPTPAHLWPPPNAVHSTPPSSMPPVVPDPATAGMPEMTEAAKSPPSAAPFARSTRPAGKSDKSSATPGGGVVMEPPAATLPLNSPRGIRTEAHEANARTDANEAEAPEAPLVGAPSGANAEAGAADLSPQEAKPEKTGNRFIRALGRLNPFRKRATPDSGEPAEVSASKD